MKSLLKVVAVGSAIALGAAALPTNSDAGEWSRGDRGRDERRHDDRGWATVGKVLTGVAAFGLLAGIIHDAEHRVAVRIDHGAPVPPPPPVCEPPRRWIPGHYECRPERVCIPGYWDTVTEPAQYGWVRYGCHSEYVMIRPACTRNVWVPERYETREARVWMPAHVEDVDYAYNR